MTPISPNGEIELAVTVDDLLIFDGLPIPPGYSREKIVESIIETFAKYQLGGIYAFSCTSMIEDDPGLGAILENWVDQGHHVGNHTHCHASLSWVTGKCYCDDIERSEEYIGDLIDKAPERYFRYAMDATGSSEAKRGEVEDFLARNNYVNAPITAWFHDVRYAWPYCRALENNDQEAIDTLLKHFVTSSVAYLRGHAKASRQMFGRDIPYIWLCHATPIVMDALDSILHALSHSGVRFVSLETAMKDPVHLAMPKVSHLFTNHLERYALAQGVEVEGTPHEDVEKAMQLSPLEGFDEKYDEVKMIRKMCDRAGGNFVPLW